jgi:hypothetical protein
MAQISAGHYLANEMERQDGNGLQFGLCGLQDDCPLGLSRFEKPHGWAKIHGLSHSV